ncbi:MAG: zf-HC2 domain-containing protein [Pseudomonadota bacterium]
MNNSLFRNCREVTRLVLAGEDRRLGLVERLSVRLHMQICAACPKFARQVDLMRRALPRWRAYRDSDD